MLIHRTRHDLGLSVGLGFDLAPTLGLDLGYQYLGFQGAETQGTSEQISFEGQAHLLGLAFRYRAS